MREGIDRPVIEKHDRPISSKCMNKIEHWITCTEINNMRMKYFKKVTKRNVNDEDNDKWFGGVKSLKKTTPIKE